MRLGGAYYFGLHNITLPVAVVTFDMTLFSLACWYINRPLPFSTTISSTWSCKNMQAFAECWIQLTDLQSASCICIGWILFSSIYFLNWPLYFSYSANRNSSSPATFICTKTAHSVASLISLHFHSIAIAGLSIICASQSTTKEAHITKTHPWQDSCCVIGHQSWSHVPSLQLFPLPLPSTHPDRWLRLELILNGRNQRCSEYKW